MSEVQPTEWVDSIIRLTKEYSWLIGFIVSIGFIKLALVPLIRAIKGSKEE